MLHIKLSRREKVKVVYTILTWEVEQGSWENDFLKKTKFTHFSNYFEVPRYFSPVQSQLQNFVAFSKTL